MNILHMRYALEVARIGSINKASEALLIAQPNLSRSIKELEADLGITIFDRSAKGMVLTPEGETFIKYAKRIISQIDELEKKYKNGSNRKMKFSVSVPRACYISEAFARFTANIGSNPAKFTYKETDSLNTINNILGSDYKLGIIRYAEIYDRQFKNMLDEKQLAYELIAEFNHVLVMSAKNPLAQKSEISSRDLPEFIQIAHADSSAQSLPVSEIRRQELPDDIQRRIFVFERASMFEILSQNCRTFMWASPVPKELLKRFGLVQRVCIDNDKRYRDVLICRNDYRFSELDNRFITELCNSKRKCFD